MGVLSSCCIAALLHVLPTLLQGNHVRLCSRRLLLSCKPASTTASDMMQCEPHCVFATGHLYPYVFLPVMSQAIQKECFELARSLAVCGQRCRAQVLSRQCLSRSLNRAHARQCSHVESLRQLLTCRNFHEGAAGSCSATPVINSQAPLAA